MLLSPNLTEASFMLGVDYVGEDYDEAYIRDLLKQLTGLGCKTAVLTGVSLPPARSAPWPMTPPQTRMPAISMKSSL